MQKIERPKSLTELVTETVRDWIITGQKELGGAISEAQLAKELNVSRTPVREAMNRLEMEGLLTVEPQRGAFIFDLGPDELAKICDARSYLETAALEEAMMTNSAALRVALADIVDKMAVARDEEDDARYLALDMAYHQAFFDHSDNRFLDDAYQAIAFKMAALRSRLGRHPAHMTLSYKEHKAILERVAAGDLEAARNALRSHIGRKDGTYWELATTG